MSKPRLLSSLALIAGALALTARFAVLSFPISAPAQEIARGGDNLFHHPPIAYPPAALEKGIEGTVIVSATLDDHGVVSDARVVSGPEPLRKAALRSVLDWHYHPGTSSPVEIAIEFKLPTGGPSTVVAPLPVKPGVIKEIRFQGVSRQIQDAVIASLPARVGDPFEGGTVDRIRQAARGVDEHLEVSGRRMTAGEEPTQYGVTISYATTPQRIRVGGGVQQAMILSRTVPKYPPQAKLDRIQGVVKLAVIINKDGTVQDVQVISGEPVLAEVAMEAVRQWVYKPTLLNGEPVEVNSVVDVNFTLSQ